MNNYYIDGTASTNGDGSYSSPYNDISVLGSVNFSHPCTINIKRNSVFVGNWDFSSSNVLVNASGQASQITTYGNGCLPVFIQEDPTLSTLKLKLRNIQTFDFKFIPHKNNNDIHCFVITGSPDPVTYNAEVETHRNRFVNIFKCNRPLSMRIIADSTLSYPTHRMRAYNTECIDMYSGIQFIGNPGNGTEDPNYNLTDKLKMYGARSEGLYCVNMGGDALIHTYCASKDTTMPPEDADTSYGSHVFYSGYKPSATIKTDGTIGTSVAVWPVYSNHILYEWLEIQGGAPQQYDQTAFDFDIRAVGCKIRYFFTRNNSGGLLLAVDKAQGAPAQGTLSNKEFFINRGWGNRDNVIEYGISFNDGIRRDSSWAPWSSKVRLFNKVNNLTVRNITFIETASTRRMTESAANSVLCQHYPDFTTADAMGNPSITLDSCLFYYRDAIGWDAAVGSNANTATVVNCGAYSEKMGPNGATISASSAGSISGMVYSDPLFEYIPSSAPCDMEAAKLIKFLKTSEYYNKGTSQSIPDIMGNTGNAIGWLQIQ